VQALDAVFGVLPVAAHVPLADPARRARYRVGPADDPDHQVTLGQPAVRRGLRHPAQVFVAEDEVGRAGRGFAVLGGDDLDVGAAESHREPVHQDGTVLGRRVGQVGEGEGTRRSGPDGQRVHGVTLPRAG
jgi:hypothetical protein